MGVVGAMFFVTGLSANMCKDSQKAKLAQSPPPGGNLLQIAQKFYWMVQLVCILGLGRIPATWGSGGNDFVLGLIANMGKDSQKAKFPQSPPRGETFCKLHRRFTGWLSLFVF